MSTDPLAALVAHLHEHSVKRGDFILKSGKALDWFLDSKQTACRPDGIALVAEVAQGIIPDEADSIGGLTMGADPVAFGVAAVLATTGRPIRSFSIRKEPKDHGMLGRLAGALEPGDRVVITEDTATRGTSILDAALAVREMGAEPILLMPLVDRGGTGAALAEKEGIAFKALVTAEDLGFEFDS
jgi:orotate phosphoribosyltransferase